jgi:hypothetical protein
VDDAREETTEATGAEATGAVGKGDNGLALCDDPNVECCAFGASTSAFGASTTGGGGDGDDVRRISATSSSNGGGGGMSGGGGADKLITNLNCDDRNSNLK